MKKLPFQLFLLPALSFLFACNSPAHKKKSKVVTAAHAVDVPQETNGENLHLDGYHAAYENSLQQHFKARPNRQSLIIARKGLRFKLDPSSFEKASGNPVTGNIYVTVVELTNTRELFRANAATTCDGKLLSSGGSYLITMHNAGEQLRLKKGKSLEVEFPVLRNSEMELFYGDRTPEGNLNWSRADIDLQKQSDASAVTFQDTDSNPGSFLPGFTLDERGFAKMFPNLKETVYYYEKLISIEDLLDSVNKTEVRLIIDTVRMWPAQTVVLLRGQRIDSNYLRRMYGPEYQYIIKSAKQKKAEEIAEASVKAAANAVLDTLKATDIASQIVKYYRPANITRLGWLNCDRFYNPEFIEAELEVPLALSGGEIKYFLLFPAVNGLVSSGVKYDSARYLIKGLPFGQRGEIIAFVKAAGKIYHGRMETIFGISKTLNPDFKEISEPELKKIFGKNIRT